MDLLTLSILFVTATLVIMVIVFLALPKQLPSEEKKQIKERQKTLPPSSLVPIPLPPVTWGPFPVQPTVSPMTKTPTVSPMTKTPTVSPMTKTPMQAFREIKGLSGAGYCKGPDNSFPYYQSFANLTKAECEAKCSQDPDCVAYNVNDGQCASCKPFACQLFSRNKKDKYTGPASKNWKPSLPFPSFASPYNCPDEIKKQKCLSGLSGRSLYPDSCTLVKGNSCFAKTKTNEGFTFSPFVRGPGEDNDPSVCKIIVSNPFLFPDQMLKTEGTFFTWLLQMLQQATQFIILANAYITLGLRSSEDPSNLQNQFYWAFRNALERGVKIYCIRIENYPSECALKTEVSKFASQPGIREHLGKNLIYVNFGNNQILFFHDKIYISEKEAYVGGQNMSSPSSIDIGVAIPKTSALYNDVFERAKYLLANTKYTLRFQYTSQNPYIDAVDGGYYYVTVGPYYPICQDLQTLPCSFPQRQCPPFDKETGPYFVNGQWNNVLGNVTYDWPQIVKIINGAKTFLFLTSFDFSMFGDTLAEKNGYDRSILDAIENAVKRGVQVDIWVHNSPITDQLCNGNPTCSFFRCQEGQDWIQRVTKLPNIKMHYWYPNPIDRFNNCKDLHAKIFYSDYGVLISTSNLTPTYYLGTLGTSLCNIFNDYKVPEWASKGMARIQKVLSDHSQLKDKNKTVCNNLVPNFNTQSMLPTPLCPDGVCHQVCAPYKQTQKCTA